MHVVVAVSGQSSVHCACQRDSFRLPSCMCTSIAHASLLPAAERATRPTANISTSPRRSAPACKRRAQSTSMSLSDRLEIFGEQAQMYPQGTRKASKVGCKAHRAHVRTHQKCGCIFGTEEYTFHISSENALHLLRAAHRRGDGRRRDDELREAGGAHSRWRCEMCTPPSQKYNHTFDAS